MLGKIFRCAARNQIQISFALHMKKMKDGATTQLKVRFDSFKCINIFASDSDGELAALPKPILKTS